MKLSERYDTRTGFIDFLLGGQTNLFVFLVIALALYNPVSQKTEGIEHKAEMVMTVKWADGMECDVDTWVRGPTGDLVWYSEQDKKYMHIERDDTGTLNDKMLMNGVEIVNVINEEFWTLRAKVPGEYVVNVALFACQNKALADVVAGIPVKVSIELQKINPSVKTVNLATVELKRVKEEVHAFRFTLDANGNVTRVWFEPVRLVKSDNSVNGIGSVPQ